MVKLPRLWINLATVRQIQLGDAPGKIIIVYDTGDFDTLDGIQAQLLLNALEQINYIDKSEVK